MAVSKIKTSDALKYADPSLWRDRNFVEWAVSHQGNTIKYAGPNLWRDRDFIMWAVTKHEDALKFKAPTSWPGRNFEWGPTYFTHQVNTVKCAGRDRDIVFAAVRHFGSALAYVDGILRRDRDIVLAAVNNFGSALEHADKSFRSDRGLVLAGRYE